MSFAIKRSWTHDLEDADEDEDWNLRKAFIKKQRLSVSGPLTEANQTGLVTPPETPEKDRLKNTQISIGDKVIRKLQFNEEVHSPYLAAKNLFMRGSQMTASNDYYLPGRQTEARILKTLIENSLRSLHSTSIYISGPPGTGKTAELHTLLKASTEDDNQNTDPDDNIYTIYVPQKGSEIARKVRIIEINCMTLNDTEGIFNLMAREMHLKCNKKSKIDQIRKELANDNHCDMTILLLDEMDSIISKYQQELFELFSWGSKFACDVNDQNRPRLILIGIANALDLTDRFLPRLRSNRINPNLVQFLPYTAAQIKEIITTKLQSLNNNNKKGLPPMVHPAGILFCAKKSAVSTGDLRKAFDIMYESIEQVERKTIKRLTPTQFNQLTIENAPKVTIAQVASVCNSMLSTNYKQKLDSLNFQSKVLLCCLFKFEEKQRLDNFNSSKKTIKLVPSINAFFEFYSRFLEEVDRMLCTLKRAEFMEVLNMLESNSLVSLNKLPDNTKKFASVQIQGKMKRNIKGIQSQMINFGNYEVSTNVPKKEFSKTISNIELLEKLMSSKV